MTTTTETLDQATTLAKKIRAHIEVVDAAGRLLPRVHGERRHFLFGTGTGQPTAEFDTLTKLNQRIKSNRDRSLAHLEILLPEATKLVVGLMGETLGDAERALMTLLATTEESALVRCERAADYLDQRLPAKV